MKKLIAWSFVGACLLSCARPVMAGPARFEHVIVAVLENTNADEAAKQPFFAQLAKQGTVLSNFHAVAHPSQPNYIAMISGSTLGVRSDSPVDLGDSHLGDLLEARGLSWKVYAEDYPGNCFLGSQSAKYARKHVPFLSFTNVSADSARCARIVDGTAFDSDTLQGRLPNYSFYVPNLNNDGHDTGVKYADHWLSIKFGPLLGRPDFLRNTLFVVTFDENEVLSGDFSNRIFTVAIGDQVQAGYVSSRSYDHYSLLRTIEDNFGLGTLGRADATADPISDIWKQ